MKVIVAAAVAALTIACSEPATRTSQKSGAVSPTTLGRVSDLPVPSFQGAARVPFLHATSDAVLLSWMEEVRPKVHALRFADFNGTTWRSPKNVAVSDAFFVNWADTPSIVRSGPHLYAHWLQKSGEGKYSYDVNVATSDDGGETWSSPVVPHRNPVKSEYGFVSMLPDNDGSVGLTWLDGRAMPEEGVGAMAIRYARLSPEGTLSGEIVLDERTCECCQTGIARTAKGPLVVYRDRSENELRDIARVRVDGARATTPKLVHADQWLIPGCPVNGPQADAIGNDTVVAWFTEAGGVSKVRTAFSSDGGDTFSPVQDLSIHTPLGRVDVVMIDKETAAVSWLEKRGEQASVRVQIVTRSGKNGQPLTLGMTSAARPSGFPRMVRFRDSLLIAWTLPGEKSTIVMKKVEITRA